jgi:hypothetical protein
MKINIAERTKIGVRRAHPDFTLLLPLMTKWAMCHNQPESNKNKSSKKIETLTHPWPPSGKNYASVGCSPVCAAAWARPPPLLLLAWPIPDVHHCSFPRAASPLPPIKQEEACRVHTGGGDGMHECRLRVPHGRR